MLAPSNGLRLLTMAPALAPRSSPEAREEDVDDNGIARRDTRHERAVGIGEKSNKDRLATDSDSSDQEPPKEFKEGGYGW